MDDRFKHSIPANNISVMDSSMYRNVEHNKAQAKCALKSEIILWLERNKIHFESTT
jgi:hypothetical protein